MVLGVGDVICPVRFGAFNSGRFGDGQVSHEVVGCGAVPVPLLRRGVDDVSGPDLLDLAAAGLHETLAFGAYRVWATAWECHALRADGVKCTALMLTRDGSAACTRGSM